MSYSDDRYGIRRKVLLPTADAIGAAAVHPDIIQFAKKTKIYKFGIVAQDNDVRCSSDTILELCKGNGGATVATFVFTAAAVIAATEAATGVTLATPLTVDAGSVLQAAVGVIGSGGNFQWYLDVQESFVESENE